MITEMRSFALSPLYITTSSPSLAPTRYQWSEPKWGEFSGASPLVEILWEIFSLAIVFLTYWSGYYGRAKVLYLTSGHRNVHPILLGLYLSLFLPLVAVVPFITFSFADRIPVDNYDTLRQGEGGGGCTWCILEQTDVSVTFQNFPLVRFSFWEGLLNYHAKYPVVT